MNFIKNIKKKKLLSKPLFTLFVIALSSTVLSSCSSTKNDGLYNGGVVVYDPMEEQNRQIMAFNQSFHNAITNPVLRGYRTITPQPARSGIRNFLRNLKSPMIFVNQVLQGDISGARDVVLRAAINSSIGVGGIFDVAGYEGIEYEPEDFGQTLAVWGVGHGPYTVLPFIGPSSLRDYSGYLVDALADPLRLYLFNNDQKLLYTAKFSAEHLDLRDSLMDTLAELEASSIDYYAAVRSTYYQHREALIKDQKGTAQSSIPAIPYYEDE